MTVNEQRHDADPTQSNRDPVNEGLTILAFQRVGPGGGAESTAGGLHEVLISADRRTRSGSHACETGRPSAAAYRSENPAGVRDG